MSIRKVELLKIIPGCGDFSAEKPLSFGVWAECREPTERTQFAAMASSFKVERVAYFRRSEFFKHDFTHVKIDSKNYKIITVSEDKTSAQKVRVLLSQGDEIL